VQRGYKEDYWGNQEISVLEALMKGTVGREAPFREDFSPEAEE
jgi:hypothetical protein